jgi:hypothetical protein
MTASHGFTTSRAGCDEVQGMPTLRTHKSLRRPWHARRRRNYIEYSLGYYGTREHAADVERIFDALAPSQVGLLYSVDTLVTEDALCQSAADQAVKRGKMLLAMEDEEMT